IENPLGNPQVFEDLQVFREMRCLPDTAPDGGIHIRKMIKAITQSIAVRWILDDSAFAINRIQRILPLMRRSRHRYLPAVHRAYSRIIKIAVDGLQATLKLVAAVLSQNQH